MNPCGPRGQSFDQRFVKSWAQDDGRDSKTFTGQFEAPCFVQ